jgi:hypothetical protein
MCIKSATKFLVLSAFILTLILPAAVFARIGVGVGLGRIQVDEPLRAGGIYDLPMLPVLNTGTEPLDYQISVQYHEGQELDPAMGLRPAEAWFSFTPSLFHLEPGKAEPVKIVLTLPTQIKPGNYFAYLEARPVTIDEAGVAAIGIAAATTLHFTVAPANIFQAIYYRLTSLYSRYHPWNTIVLAVLFVIALLWFLSRKFQFSIARK